MLHQFCCPCPAHIYIYIYTIFVHIILYSIIFENETKKIKSRSNPFDHLSVLSNLLHPQACTCNFLILQNLEKHDVGRWQNFPTRFVAPGNGKKQILCKVNFYLVFVLSTFIKINLPSASTSCQIFNLQLFQTSIFFARTSYSGQKSIEDGWVLRC